MTSTSAITFTCDAPDCAEAVTVTNALMLQGWAIVRVPKWDEAHAYREGESAERHLCPACAVRAVGKVSHG